MAGAGEYGTPLMLERLMLLVVMLLDTTNLGAVTLPVEPGVRTMFPEPLFAWISTLLFAPNAPIVTLSP